MVLLEKPRLMGDKGLLADDHRCGNRTDQKSTDNSKDAFDALVMKLTELHEQQIGQLQAENALLRSRDEKQHAAVDVNQHFSKESLPGKEKRLQVALAKSEVHLQNGGSGMDFQNSSEISQPVEAKREVHVPNGGSQMSFVNSNEIYEPSLGEDAVATTGKFEVSECWQIPEDVDKRLSKTGTMLFQGMADPANFGQPTLKKRVKGRTLQSLLMQGPEARRLQSDITIMSETDLAVEETETCIFMSYPSSKVRLAWDLLGMCLIFYDIISIPMLEAFNVEPNTTLNRIDVASTAFWTCDIIASFCVGYVAEGETIMDPYRVARHYARTWLIPDLWVLSIDWASPLIKVLHGSSGDSSRAFGLVRALRVVRMVRLVRLLKLRRVVSKIHDQVNSEYVTVVLDFMKLLFAVLILSHFTACLWYFIGVSGMDNRADNWIERYKIEEYKLDYKYATSLHIMLLAFTLESIVECQNTTERWFTVVVTIFGIVGFSTILSRITSLMVQIQSMRTDSAKQFWLLRRFLKERYIAKNLAVRIEKYLEFQIEKHSKAVQESQIPILAQLSDQLQTELRFELMVRSVAVHPFFGNLQKVSDVTMHRVCALTLTRRSFAVDDPIFFFSEKATFMFFVSSGRLGYGLHQKDDIGQSAQPAMKHCTTVAEKEWISEATLWTSWRHQGDCFAQTEVDLMILDALKFQEVLLNNHRVWLFASRYAAKFIQQLNDMIIPSDIVHGSVLPVVRSTTMPDL